MKEQKSTDEALVGLDGSEQENTESDVCTDTVDGKNLIDDLKATIVRNDKELNESKVRINDLEQEIALLLQNETDLKSHLSAVQGTLSDAITGYRSMVVKANPEVVAELVTGDSIEAVNESLEKAKDLVGKVRKNLENEMANEKFPIGVPERRSKGTSALSSRDKIRYAIGGKT